RGPSAVQRRHFRGWTLGVIAIRLTCFCGVLKAGASVLGAAAFTDSRHARVLSAAELVRPAPSTMQAISRTPKNVSSCRLEI
ncbi:hypothetical protein, partial [Streptomyces sp. Tu 4128]|uniref:hypothetical protein n=1 Tax=Streptomyces sp. Tu 4128 TaxID=1120314 RepID=UPI0019D09FF6